MNRKQLLAASLAAVVVGDVPVLAQGAAGAAAQPTRNRTSLVLPGGGARGAFEAGVIEGLRARAGVSDGVALPGLFAVFGTSIGAINGWFVATAQYSLLAQLWQSISGDRIFELKHRYLPTVTPSSGVMSRIIAAALVSYGLTTNVTGLLDGRRVHEWLARHIDPTTPLVLPFIFTVTNLEQQRAEVFYRSPVVFSAAAQDAATRAVRNIFGKSITARAVENQHLISALAGSSAIPILFDPVTIAFADGPQTYVDGGVADSAPIDLARALSNRVQLILVDPADVANKPYLNAAAVGTAAFGIAQSRILEASLRSAYLETHGKRLFAGCATTPEQEAFLRQTFDVDLELIRPNAELPVDVPSFDDQANLTKTYELGRQAGLAGFRDYRDDRIAT